MESVQCSLCGSTKSASYENARYHLNLLPPLDIKRCNQCGFVFMSPRPDAKDRQALFSDQVPELLRPYASNGANYGAVTEGRLSFFRRRLSILAKHLKKPVNELEFLDIGASSGFMVQAAMELGIKANGIEPGVSGIEAASRRGVSLLHGTAEALPFHENVFDIVHSHHVFEHVAGPLKAAKEAYRVLKPGGILLIEVPNQFANIRFRRDEILGRVYQRERGIRSVHHLNFFSTKTMRLMLYSAGFRNISVTTRYAVMPKGWMALGGYLTMLAGMFYLGGERIIATATK